MDLTPIAPKLARLISRLASDRDGEVLACVAAIRRQLAAHGADLHDLAAALEPRREVVFLEAPDWTPRTWHDLARWVPEADGGRLKPRERAFVADMRRRLVLRGEPSEKQGDWLRALYARLGRAE